MYSSKFSGQAFVIFLIKNDKKCYFSKSGGERANALFLSLQICTTGRELLGGNLHHREGTVFSSFPGGHFRGSAIFNEI